MTSRDSYVTTADPHQTVSLHVPAFEELWFKQRMLEDAGTMSYNHAYGGTISFPREKWSAWYDRWISHPDGKRFYRYLKNREGEFAGECAWHYDEDRDIFLADVLIYAPVRGKGYGSGGLRSGVVDLRSAGCEFGEVDTHSAAVAEGTGGLASALEDALDGVLGRLYDVAVGEGDFEAGVLESAVGEDTSSEKELFLQDHPLDIVISGGNTVEPMIERLPVVTVLFVPNVYSKLIFSA